MRSYYIWGDSVKKIIILCFTYLLTVLINFEIATIASDDYNTYSEIMMTNGKTLSNFLDSEIKNYLSLIPDDDNPMFGVKIYEANKNVEASYISNTLYSVENKGETDVEYEINVTVETNNKVSFSVNGSINGKGSASKEKIKGEISAECGVKYDETTTESRKEVRKLKFIVEGNSRAIVYLTGNMSITNGAAKKYSFWTKSSEGGFEIVTLKNQYTRIEKVKISWKG